VQPSLPPFETHLGQHIHHYNKALVAMAFQDNKGATAGSDGYSNSGDQPEMGQSRPVKRKGFSLAVDQEPSSFAPSASSSNADFDPIPPSKRTWGAGSFVAYWMADAWAVSNWEVGM
jgi:NCS1 family nucleobase:cation symporter-1